MLQELMLKLDEHNIAVDPVPPNRALFVQPHLPVWAGLSLGNRSAFYEYHQRGGIMHTRYPGPVGGDNLDIHSCLPGSPRWDSLPKGGWVVKVVTWTPNHRDTQDRVWVSP